MAAGEAAHALHERLLRARGDEQHAHAAHRALLQRPRELEHDGHAREVVVGARHDRARGDVGERRGRAEREEGAEPPQRPEAEQGAERHQRRARGDEQHHLRRGLLAVVPLRERVGRHRRQLRREHQPAVRGVVVGDEHDRALRVAVARLGDDVVGGPVRERPAEDVRAARDVVGDPGGRRRADRRAPAPARHGRRARPRARPAPRPPSSARAAPNRCRVHALPRSGRQHSNHSAAPGSILRHVSPRPRPTVARSRRDARRWPAGARWTPAWDAAGYPAAHGRRSRLPLLQDRVGGDPRDAHRRGRAHDHLHGHQPRHARARPGDPARAREGPALDRPRAISRPSPRRPSGSPPRCPSGSRPTA